MSSQGSARSIDADFLAQPLDAVADAAIAAATSLGASFADVRVMVTATNDVSMRDRDLQSSLLSRAVGVGVRVIHGGVWGFASASAADPDSAADAAARAVSLARISAAIGGAEVELAPEPSHRGSWVSDYDLDPTLVSLPEVVGRLTDWVGSLLDAGVDHVDASFTGVKEQVFYANSEGTRVVQQRVRCHPVATAVAVTGSGFEEMTTTCQPSARGWEYAFAGQWQREISELPELLAERVRAPSLAPGRYDLVIDPTNLWLTIHESVGHATEYDRAIGLEANYAGTSFAVPKLLGSFRYGSPLMTVTGDRVTPYGLATTGWDDEGVAATSWDIVREGVLVGYQLDRSGAHDLGLDRSNGCAYADSHAHVPLQRMPNVSLQPDPRGGDLTNLISGVEDGLLAIGDKSWSIDMARYNFQFTAQRFLRIRAGRIVGQVKDVAYQSTTPNFWGSLAALGGPATYLLGGALNCGKGQPGQTAAVSHGCPAAVFTDVNVLATGGDA